MIDFIIWIIIIVVGFYIMMGFLTLSLICIDFIKYLFCKGNKNG